MQVIRKTWRGEEEEVTLSSALEQDSEQYGVAERALDLAHKNARTLAVLGELLVEHHIVGLDVISFAFDKYDLKEILK